jgi:hypothetical protein
MLEKEHLAHVEVLKTFTFREELYSVTYVPPALRDSSETTPYNTLRLYAMSAQDGRSYIITKDTHVGTLSVLQTPDPKEASEVYNTFEFPEGWVDEKTLPEEEEPYYGRW